MTKTIFRIAALAVALAGMAGAENATMERWQSCNLYNGRFWQDNTLVTRMVFLGGVLDMRNSDSKTGLWPDGMTVSEMVRSLDKVYADPANMRIPIVLAVGIAAGHFRGIEPKIINTIQREMRQYAATCQWEDEKKEVQ